jgi:tetratricopeptide (TPR) repeat protein
MATALDGTTASPVDRRREIEEWHSSLATLTDAEILGLPGGATPEQLRAAFLSLARRFHPDTAAAADEELRHQLQSIFIRISEAYRHLSRHRWPRPTPPPRPTPSARIVVSPLVDDTASRRARVEDALREAEDLVQRRQAEEAVSVLHEVLTQADEPRRRRIQLLLARAYAIDARWRRNAVVLLRQLVEQDANDAEALAALGVLYQRDGLLARADSMFVRALAADPGLAEARTGLRAVRAALLARRTPPALKGAPRRGLISRLFSVAR